MSFEAFQNFPEISNFPALKRSFPLVGSRRSCDLGKLRSPRGPILCRHALLRVVAAKCPGDSRQFRALEFLERTRLLWENPKLDFVPEFEPNASLQVSTLRKALSLEIILVRTHRADCAWLTFLTLIRDCRLDSLGASIPFAGASKKG